MLERVSLSCPLNNEEIRNIYLDWKVLVSSCFSSPFELMVKMR